MSSAWTLLRIVATRWTTFSGGSGSVSRQWPRSRVSRSAGESTAPRKSRKSPTLSTSMPGSGSKPSTMPIASARRTTASISFTRRSQHTSGGMPGGRTPLHSDTTPAPRSLAIASARSRNSRRRARPSTSSLRSVGSCLRRTEACGHQRPRHQTARRAREGGVEQDDAEHRGLDDADDPSWRRVRDGVAYRRPEPCREQREEDEAGQAAGSPPEDEQRDRDGEERREAARGGPDEGDRRRHDLEAADEREDEDIGEEDRHGPDRGPRERAERDAETSVQCPTGRHHGGAHGCSFGDGVVDHDGDDQPEGHEERAETGGRGQAEAEREEEAGAFTVAGLL